MTPLRRHLSGLAQAAARCFGSRLADAETGKVLGRAFLVPWRGRVLFVGYDGPPLRPVFLPQERVTYWKQEIGFAAPPPPDFPSLEKGERE